MRIKEYELTISKSGLPCLWESGGGFTNIGNSFIITNHEGKKKQPIYIRRSGELACGDHALIPIQKGDYGISVYRGRSEYDVYIYEFNNINIENKTVDCNVINKFSEGEWDSDPDLKFKEAVESAKAKSRDYHCRSPYYVLPIKSKH